MRLAKLQKLQRARRGMLGKVSSGPVYTWQVFDPNGSHPTNDIGAQFTTASTQGTALLAAAPSQFAAAALAAQGAGSLTSLDYCGKDPSFTPTHQLDGTWTPAGGDVGATFSVIGHFNGAADTLVAGLALISIA